MLRSVLVRLPVLAWTLGISSLAHSGDIDFARDVRPILSANCIACHGPDDAHREAELRLDVRDDVDGVRGAAAVTADGEAGALIERITTDDPDLRMPPPDSGKSLTAEQISILRQWVENGAPFRSHWAFERPQRPTLPSVDDSGWIRSPIDRFILARLEREGLRPSPEAARETLIRRLSLDLTGLPPTPDEVDAFLADRSVDACERLVDRLLASPRFGEHQAVPWLDAARYADSDGFEKDKPRQVWMYREWVIDAFNSDLPYDRFIIDQIAGDLRPGGGQEALVATGFLRNSMINEEGGVDPEQFRMEAMFDRMDAIGKAILGLTMQCGQCHNHKYDPLTQTDYYRVFAFFNNCHEAQVTVYSDNDLPRREAILGEIRRLEAELRAAMPDWAARMQEWEDSIRDTQPEWTIVRPQLDSSGGQKHYLLEDGSILAQGYAPTKHTTEFTVEVPQPEIAAVRLELLNDPNLPHGGPGRSIFGLCALTEFRATAAPLDRPEEKVDLKFSHASADVSPPERPLESAFDDKSGKARVTGPIEFANDGNDLTAWGIDIGPGRSNVPRKAVFRLAEPLSNPAGWRITFRLSQLHGGWNSDDNQNNNLGRFRFSVTSAEGAVADPVPAPVRAIFEIPPSQRTPSQVEEVFAYWRTTVPEWEAVNQQIEQLWQSHPQGTTQLVLLEREKPRVTHRLDRGNFLKPLEAVSPGVPSFLHELPQDESPNRLTFARWLVSRDSPTTARAIVNRVWQSFFGRGIVSTSEDLGLQGELPSHPELLDWLAVEFMDSGWSIKRLCRLIATSATYRQSSAVTPELYARDPDNRLLARGPRVRVNAETVRDIALATSGLLEERIGGPSVYPPAPEFLFQPPASYGPKTWNTAEGPDRYRRAVYTFRFRSVPYPALQTFDAPNGDFSCVRRVRSNTPLQALTALNEPLFVECARGLARLTLSRCTGDDQARIAWMFRRCLARQPTPEEGRILREFLEEQQRRLAEGELDPGALSGAAAADTGDSSKSASSIGVGAEGQPQAPAARSAEADITQLAAYTALARVLLNLDETLTRE